MMSKLNLFFAAGFLWLAAMNFGGAARAANFTASLDRDSITIGESATLSLKFDDASPQNPPALPEMPGLDVGTPVRQLFSSDFNGIRNSSVIYAFPLTPQKAGEFTIPAITADVGGQRLVTTPLKLTATQPQAPTVTDINSGNQIAFAKLTLPKKKIYAGEIIVADLQVFYRQDTRLAQEPQLMGLANEGFSTGKIASGSQSQTQIGSTVYNVIPAKIALTAIKPGPLSIGPVTVGLVLDVPSENRPATTFGGFIINYGGERKQFSLSTQTFKNESLPLPVENVPPDFNGAVGDYTMTMTVGPTNVPAGDPVTMRVQISGRGALDNLRLPDLSAWRDFKVFPPTSKIEITDPLGIEGTKTFEEIVTPQSTDVRALPQFSFSFFNPADGKYCTLTNPPVPLVVRAGGVTTMPTIAATKNSTAENPTPQDILPIMENLGTLETKSVPLVAQPVFLAVQSLPVIAFLAAFVWRKRTDNLANNPRLRRQRAVAQLVNGGLGDLNRFAAENKSNEFFAMLFRLLQEQLGERLDCPATSITEADVDKRLIYIGASPATLESLRELFQLCNQARYAPIQTRQELAAVAAKFKKVVGELQNLKP